MRIAERLAKQVGPRRYSMWFDRSARFGIGDGDGPEGRRRLEVAVPNRFVADWIGKHFTEQLEHAARHEVGSDVDLSVEVNPELFAGGAALADREVEPVVGEAAADPAGGVSGAVSARLPEGERVVGPGVACRYSLDDFVVGPNNELAYAAATNMIEHEQAALSPLFVHGGCGLGKTHLLQGVCRMMLRSRPDARVLYTPGEQFTNEFLTAVRTNKIDAFRRRIRGLDLLAVDDVHFLADKPATQREFLHTFDAIERGGARVVLASDTHPRSIPQFSESLVSRCVRGLVVEVHAPDTSTRSRIVMALAKRRGLVITEEVAQGLATSYAGSVRDLEGVLTKLHAMAHLVSGRRGGAVADQGMLTVGPEVIRRLYESEPRGRDRDRVVCFNTILRVVSQELRVEPVRVTGRSRQRDVVMARSLVVYLTRKLTPMSYPEIASAMGRRAHSTIVTADQRIAKLVSGGEQVALRGVDGPVVLSEVVARLGAAIRAA